jgi:hypothetical protein
VVVVVKGDAMELNKEQIAKLEEIYRKTVTFFPDQIKFPGFDYRGFKILNSKPDYMPPIFFIGYQPGGGTGHWKREFDSKSYETWPSTNGYVDGSWPLARKIRWLFEMFPKELERSMGLNAIFIRAANATYYRNHLDRDLRACIEKFCLTRVGEIIEVISPKRIVVFGFETLSLFGSGESYPPDLTNSKGKILTRTGEIANRKVIAMLHPTGAWRFISKLDQDRIRDRVLAFVDLPHAA